MDARGRKRCRCTLEMVAGPDGALRYRGGCPSAAAVKAAKRDPGVRVVRDELRMAPGEGHLADGRIIRRTA